MEVIVGDSAAEAGTKLRHKRVIAADRTAPLALLVHGRAGNYDVMWTFRRTLPEGISIVAPQAPLPDPLGGYSWWDLEAPDKMRRGAEEAAAQVQNFLEKYITYYNLAPRTLIAYGFSQGAGLLSVLLQRQPELFAGVALLAGFVIALDDPPVSVSLPPVFMAHGERDPAITLEKARHGAKVLEDKGYQVEFITDDVTHKVGTLGMRALKNWSANLLQIG